jgi:predicted ATPase
MYSEALEKVKSSYNMRVGARNNIVSNIAKATVERDKFSDMADRCSKVLELLNQVSAEARDKAKTHLESIVTEALQFVSGNDYEFKIEMLDRGKPSCDFYVESTINGIRSRQKPENACGGGFVDIISTALRYAYLEIFSEPTIMNSMLILDEPGKMVSEQASVRFGNFIKFLGNNFGKQTIMITHNENLLPMSEKTHYVDQLNGVSFVKSVDNNVVDIDLTDIDLDNMEA